jgi:hypothetical protein
MRGWHGNNGGWGGWSNRRENWWIPLVVMGIAILLFSRLGWSWWWLFAFWWIVPAMMGSWGNDTADGEKRKRELPDDDKAKRDTVYVYSENGERLDVIDAPEKPKRDTDKIEYV